MRHFSFLLFSLVCVRKARNVTHIISSNGPTSSPQTPEHSNLATEDEEITPFNENSTRKKMEKVEERQSTQSWRTYFPLPDEGRPVTQRIRQTRWPNWVTQHDRPTRRPQQDVPKDQVTSWPNWVTRQDRPSRWQEWVSQSSRPDQGKEDEQRRNTEAITQWSHTSRDYSTEGTTDLIQRSWGSDASSTEALFHSRDVAWHFTLMKRRGAEPPTFSSSFYKDRDLRLVGKEEEEGFKVAEGQANTMARQIRRIPTK